MCVSFIMLASKNVDGMHKVMLEIRMVRCLFSLQVIALPSQTCISKVKVSDTSSALRADAVHMRGQQNVNFLFI